MSRGEDEKQRADDALAEAARKRAACWAEENAAAIAERRAWIEKNGTPLADIQVLCGKG